MSGSDSSGEDDHAHDNDRDRKLEELRQQTDLGTRAESRPATDDTDELADAMVALLADIERGDVSKTLSARDARLAALVRGLEATDQLDDVGRALQTELGRDRSDDVDRSEVLRLAIRVGLAEAAPDVLETAREAYGRHATEQF